MEEVTYEVEIATEDGQSWISTMFRNYPTVSEAINFADSIFTGRRYWRITKRTVVTTIEVVHTPRFDSLR
jgi:hypothetical protein